MTKTRCKFFLRSIEPIPNTEPPASNFLFEAWYSPELPEDERFMKWTPSGELKVTISNPAVLSEYKKGEYYYITISPFGEKNEEVMM